MKPQTNDDQSPRLSRLRGEKVLLRPVSPKDYEPLFAVELSDQLGTRWRHEGATPSFEYWVQLFWTGVLAQFLVVPNGAGAPCALVTAYSANHKDQWCYVAVARLSSHGPVELPFHGLALFIEYLFSTWPFRKLYAEASASSFAGFRAASGVFFEEEGRLSRHYFRNGEWEDMHILSLSRERWSRWSTIVLARVIEGTCYRQTGTELRSTRRWV
jgi:RimJ/RimL family protein N-acetyltransferase